MSLKKLVTSAQIESLRTMANAKGVSREVFQGWLDKNASGVLDGLVEMSERIWKTWKIIRPGVFKDIGEIRRTLKLGRCYISDGAENILRKLVFTVNETEQDVELVDASAEELGFKFGGRYSAICSTASKFCLDLCPAEFGPLLRLLYKDQPKETRMVVAMKAIDGSLFILGRYRDGERYLDVHYGNDEYVWCPGQRFVFIRRPKSV